MISKYDLSQDQWEQVEKLANDTEPQGQFFWIEGETVFVGNRNNQGFEMWIAQGGDPETLINFSVDQDY